ncbi:MAG: prolyl oligopeptidase family serine peptidase, partial [Candidatus Promineofilum sp.]|nr:prolyl oligopeptidase family serine peptidase [Promineifilum sp.]
MSDGKQTQDVQKDPATAPADAAKPAPARPSAEVGGPNDTRVRVDGVPLDVNVALPSGTARNTPLVVLMHGWGGKKSGADEMTGWARRGYSVLSYTARGWFGSCGKLNSTTNLLAIDPAGCAKGYTHLADARYEIRDTQNLVGLLVDSGFANPAKIGFTGGSYGGGQSVMLAVLGQQQMRPDGKLLQWFSPGGTPIQPAAAAPFIPWTDLGYSLVPNGATLDYAIRPLTADLSPLGIQKQSFVGGLYAVTGNGANLAPPGTDPTADLTRWNSLFNRGEPYGKAAAAAGRELATFHSGYGILDKVIKAGPPVGLTSAPPIPTLIINGWTDDLFPADEATRWVNRMRQKYPKVPVKQMFLDVGHMRGQNKPGDTARWQAAVRAWFDYYVKGGAPKPAANVTAMGPVVIDNATATRVQTVGPKLRTTLVGHSVSPVYRLVTFSKGQSAAGVMKYSNGTATTPTTYIYFMLYLQT